MATRDLTLGHVKIAKGTVVQYDGVEVHYGHGLSVASPEVIIALTLGWLRRVVD